MPNPRIPLTNAVALTITSTLSSVIAYAVGLHGARELGPGPLGEYYLTVFIISYVTFLGSPGLGTIGQREVAKHPKLATRIFSSIISLQITLTSLLFLAVVAAAIFFRFPGSLQILLIINSVSVLIAGYNALWVLRARQRMVIPAIVGLVLDALQYPLMLWLITRPEDLATFAVIIIASQLAKCLFYLWYVGKTRIVCYKDIRFSRRGWKQYFLTSFPLAVSLIAIMFYYNSDSIILGFMMSVEDVGQYASAYTFMLLLCTPCFALLSAYYPVLSASLQDPDRSAPMMRSMEFQGRLAWIGLPVSAIFMAVGPSVFLALYGKEYTEASSYFGLLSSNIALIYINVGLANPLTAWGYQRIYMYITVGSALLNLLLNLVLISFIGVWGAIIATLVAELAVLVVILYVRTHQKIHPYRFLYTIAPSALFSIGTFVTLSPLPDLLATHAPLGRLLSCALGLLACGSSLVWAIRRPPKSNVGLARAEAVAVT